MDFEADELLAENPEDESANNEEEEGKGNEEEETKKTNHDFTPEETLSEEKKGEDTSSKHPSNL